MGSGMRLVMLDKLHEGHQGVVSTGVRDGGAGGGQLPPQFGQFADINSGRERNFSGKTQYMFE